MAMQMMYRNTNREIRRQRQELEQRWQMCGQMTMAGEAVSSSDDEHKRRLKKAAYQPSRGALKRSPSFLESGSEYASTSVPERDHGYIRCPEEPPKKRARGFVDLYFPTDDETDSTYVESSESTSSASIDCHEQKDVHRITETKVTATAQSQERAPFMAATKPKKGGKISELLKVFQVKSESKDTRFSVPTLIESTAAITAGIAKTGIKPSAKGTSTYGRPTITAVSNIDESSCRYKSAHHSQNLRKPHDPNMTYAGIRRLWQCCVCYARETNLYNPQAHATRTLRCRNATCFHSCCCNCSIDAVGERSDGQMLYDADIEDCENDYIE